MLHLGFSEWLRRTAFRSYQTAIRGNGCPPSDRTHLTQARCSVQNGSSAGRAPHFLSGDDRLAARGVAAGSAVAGGPGSRGLRAGGLAQSQGRVLHGTGAQGAARAGRPTGGPAAPPPGAPRADPPAPQSHHRTNATTHAPRAAVPPRAAAPPSPPTALPREGDED